MKYPTATPYRSKEELLTLQPHLRVFMNSEGEFVGLKGVTAFNLLDKFSKGIDIDQFLSKYTGINLLRVFLYTPSKDWGSFAWDAPDNYNVKNFIQMLDQYYIKLVLLTDDDPKRIQPAIDLVHYLTQFRFPNLILAAGNEPFTHKHIDVTALFNILNNSGYQFTSGVYEDLALFYGTCGDLHEERKNEWPRLPKGVREAYDGGGPNYLEEPACKVPWILGEPTRPDQALAYGNEIFCIRDYYSYGALSRLSGAGVVFHCESAKLTNEPSDFELDCFHFMMTGYEMFPPNSALGDYQHLKDLEENQTKALRIYRVGKYVVVIRPNNFIPPPNFRPLDDWSVCFELM